MVPGGFGDRGIEGKIMAIQYAREGRVPFLGICLGMQCAGIEYARNVLNFNGANSTEMDLTTDYDVIDILPEQKGLNLKGSSMRLGSYPCRLNTNSVSYSAYQNELVYERHRHRYEFNNKYRTEFLKRGLVVAGVSPDDKLVEIIEISRDIHPFFVGVQFHPEFKSRPNGAHPLFNEFIKSAIMNKKRAF